MQNKSTEINQIFGLDFVKWEYCYLLGSELMNRMTVVI